MKKLIFLSLILSAVMTACYDEYKTDYDNTATYFSYQYPARTVIIDPDADNFELSVGVVLAGLYDYGDASQVVTFEIEDTLITNNTEFVDMGIQVMPPSWYTLSNDSEFEFDGSNVAYVDVTINKEAMIGNPEATGNVYAIPFKLMETTADSILAGKDFSIVVVKFKNEFDGRYYVKGADNTLDKSGEVTSTIEYSNDALVLNKYVFMTSTARDALSVPRIGSNEDANNFVYDFTFNPEYGTAILSADTSSLVKNLVGSAAYDYESKSFICKYNYWYDNLEHSVIDTLIYSNTELNLEMWYNN